MKQLMGEDSDDDTFYDRTGAGFDYILLFLLSFFLSFFFFFFY